LSFVQRFRKVTIYRVLILPELDNIRWVQNGFHIRVTDFGWDVDAYPESPLIHLTGYRWDWKTIWYADFRRDQVELIGDPGEILFNKPNPFPTVE
jgi:hypothetical protein